LIANSFKFICTFLGWTPKNGFLTIFISHFRNCQQIKWRLARWTDDDTIRTCPNHYVAPRRLRDIRAAAGYWHNAYCGLTIEHQVSAQDTRPKLVYYTCHQDNDSDTQVGRWTTPGQSRIALESLQVLDTELDNNHFIHLLLFTFPQYVVMR
jgi:hypothetical protein